MTPTLQIIIRAEHPERGVLPLVSTLYDLRYPGMDVTIVYTEPPHDLAEARAGYPISMLALPAGTSPGAALNQAARRSDADYLVIVSNSRLPRDGEWLFHLLEHFIDPRVAAVSGEGWDPERVSLQQPSYAQDLQTFLSAPQFGLCLENLVIRRDLWSRHAFDERLAICVDRQWEYRILSDGYQVVLDYRGRLHDLAPLSEEEAFKRYWAMNLSFSQFIQPEQEKTTLWRLGLARTWKTRNPLELLRTYRALSLLRKLNFWQPTPTQAMAARATFSRPGDKWAV